MTLSSALALEALVISEDGVSGTHPNLSIITPYTGFVKGLVESPGCQFPPFFKFDTCTEVGLIGDMSGRIRYLWLLVTAITVSAFATGAGGVDLTNYALADGRVLYFCRSLPQVDWPTLYYLNDNYGCRVDIVTIAQHRDVRTIEHALPERQLFWHECVIDTTGPYALARLLTRLCDERRPDLVLLSDDLGPFMSTELLGAIDSLPPDSGALFDIARVYQEGADGVDSNATVVLNGIELAHRYRDRLESELPKLTGAGFSSGSAAPRLTKYHLTRSRSAIAAAAPDMMSGIPPLRLLEIIAQVFPEGPRGSIHDRQARAFISGFRAAQSAVGQARVDHLLDGYRSLLDLCEPSTIPIADPRGAAFHAYLESLRQRAETAAMDAAGIGWDGRIDIRDTPQGELMKFTLTVSVNGPREVWVKQVKYHPAADTNAVVLDSTAHLVNAHQSLVREYAVPVESEQIETSQPDSLLFSVDLACREVALSMVRATLLHARPSLQVRFDPDFYIVPPVSGLDVDRLVSSLALNLVITKPSDFAGPVSLDLQTPRGVFAGAYRQKITLPAGKTLEIMSVPFTISNLMELGRQAMTVDISDAGGLIAADTGYLRLAQCRIPDTIDIAYLPDSVGLLEDILRMTNASFQPLTDRGLMTANLSAYDVIVICSGAYKNYPSLRVIGDRLEDYIRWGGSVVVFGQDQDWPQGVLPFGFVPFQATFGASGIVARMPQAQVLVGPQRIALDDLLRDLNELFAVSPAEVTPAEVVLEAASGGAILSISRLGQGQMIYCGLPLPAMVADLNLEAIHLLANILNY